MTLNRRSSHRHRSLHGLSAAQRLSSTTASTRHGASRLGERAAKLNVVFVFTLASVQPTRRAGYAGR